MEENANSRKIIFGNIRGIKPLRNTTKINFIEDYSNMCNGDIICLTETHLKSEIGDSEININGYSAHRCDRERTKEGGTIIYTKNCVNASKLVEWRNNQCELVGIQIRKLNTLILCLYRQTQQWL